MQVFEVWFMCMWQASIKHLCLYIRVEIHTIKLALVISKRQHLHYFYLWRGRAPFPDSIQSMPIKQKHFKPTPINFLFILWLNIKSFWRPKPWIRVWEKTEPTPIISGIRHASFTLWYPRFPKDKFRWNQNIPFAGMIRNSGLCL